MLHSTAPEVSHLPAKRACLSPQEILKCTRLWIIGVQPYDRAAHALGITERSLRSLVLRNKSTLPEVAVTPTPTTSPLDNFTIGAIRRHVHRMFSNKQTFTVRTVAEDIKTADIIPSDTSDTVVCPGACMRVLELAWRLLVESGWRLRTAWRQGICEQGRREECVLSAGRKQSVSAEQRSGREGCEAMLHASGSSRLVVFHGGCRA
ncbi:hypothetical protein Pcinc_010721 [Petrolisthes cinctipes]|uniref:Uncharacterized protein n=1 Tax=Petrolisthes cinctipes TaxID=88211 RepID=A0AAE1KV62_PETCI|nr:hypothetical protein Pcinc_010721 [Petrolisthes cinctipes]